MMSSWNFLVIALATVAFIPFLDALKCIQCDSQPNNDHCKTSLPEAMECPMSLGNYCFKQEKYDRNGGLVMVRRFCNVLASNKNGCEDTPVKSCEYSCNTDGCNSVAGLVATRAAYLVALLPLMFYILSR